MTARKTPATGKVVPIRTKAVAEADDIVNAVRARTARANAEVSASLKELLQICNQRHTRRCQDLLPISEAMDRGLLDDWIEIGQQLLAKQGRNRRATGGSQ